MQLQEVKKEEEETPRKNEKKDTDSAQPKRHSAYHAFIEEQHKIFIDKFFDSRKAAREWKNAPDDIKNKYRKSGIKVKKSMKADKKEESRKPKRPPSAYFLWTQENRDLVVNKHGVKRAGPEYTKAAAGEWKIAPDEIKEEYAQKAGLLKKKYLQDALAYEEGRSNALGSVPLANN